MLVSACVTVRTGGDSGPDAVAAEIRRIVERALANLKEDAAAFGIDGEDKE